MKEKEIIDLTDTTQYLNESQVFNQILQLLNHRGNKRPYTLRKRLELYLKCTRLKDPTDDEIPKAPNMESKK